MKLSIISVVFNDCKKLKITLDNLRSLKNRNIEYIIIDGGSQDGTIELANIYSDVISKFVSEKDEGIYDAMNKGWKLANPNNRILFLGAGDFLTSLPDIEDYEESVILYGDVFLEKAGLFKSKVNFILKIGNTLHHQALLIPKILHPEPPFNCRYKIYADFDFNQRLYKQRMPFVYMSELVSFAAADGVSSKIDLYEVGAIVRENFGIYAMLISNIYLRCQILNSKIRVMLLNYKNK